MPVKLKEFSTQVLQIFYQLADIKLRDTRADNIYIITVFLNLINILKIILHFKYKRRLTEYQQIDLNGKNLKI